MPKGTPLSHVERKKNTATFQRAARYLNMPLKHTRGKQTLGEMAKKIGVNLTTLKDWRHLAKKAATELGPRIQNKKAGPHYAKLLYKHGDRGLAKRLRVSVEAIKGLRILLLAEGFLMESRLDWIAGQLKKRENPLTKQVMVKKVVAQIKKEFNLSERTAKRALKKAGWTQAGKR